MGLNVSIPGRDQGQAPQSGADGDHLAMESIRPDATDSLPRSPHRVGTIMIRFVGLLFLAVAAMTLVYLR